MRLFALFYLLCFSTFLALCHAFLSDWRFCKNGWFDLVFSLVKKDWIGLGWQHILGKVWDILGWSTFVGFLFLFDCTLMYLHISGFLVIGAHRLGYKNEKSLATYPVLGYLKYPYTKPTRQPTSIITQKSNTSPHPH